MRKLNNQTGAGDFGILGLVLLLAVGYALSMGLLGCIKDYKDRRDGKITDFKTQTDIDGKPVFEEAGYTVSY